MPNTNVLNPRSLAVPHHQTCRLLYSSGVIALLKPSAKLVLFGLQQHFDSKLVAFPSCRHLSDRLGVSTSTIRRGRSQLTSLGIISTSKSGSRHHTHLISIPRLSNGKLDESRVKQWVLHRRKGGISPLDRWLCQDCDPEQSREHTKQHQSQPPHETPEIDAENIQDVDVKSSLIREMGITGTAKELHQNYSILEIATARSIAVEQTPKEHRAGKAVQLLRDGAVASLLRDENKKAKMLHKLRTREFHTLERVLKDSKHIVFGGFDISQIGSDTRLQAFIDHHDIFSDQLLLLNDPPLEVVLQRLDSIIQLLDAGDWQETASDSLVEEEQIQRDLLGSEGLLPCEDPELNSNS